MELSPIERMKMGFAQVDDEKKKKIEASVRECDGILNQIRSTREVLANPEKTDFDAIKKAMEKLNSLNADLADRKDGIQKELYNVADQDFRNLINFHFSRIEK